MDNEWLEEARKISGFYHYLASNYGWNQKQIENLTEEELELYAKEYDEMDDSEVEKSNTIQFPGNDVESEEMSVNVKIPILIWIDEETGEHRGKTILSDEVVEGDSEEEILLALEDAAQDQVELSTPELSPELKLEYQKLADDLEAKEAGYVVDLKRLETEERLGNENLDVIREQNETENEKIQCQTIFETGQYLIAAVDLLLPRVGQSRDGSRELAVDAFSTNRGAAGTSPRQEFDEMIISVMEGVRKFTTFAVDRLISRENGEQINP